MTEDELLALRGDFASAKRWQDRVALLYRAIPHARTSDIVFQLGLTALDDRSYMVRYRACMVLAYALRTDALPALRIAASHTDQRTAEDARAAIEAIEQVNHHLFVDRDHTGRHFWRVNEDDVPA